MKEIKAFIHHNRIADVVHALKTSHFCSSPCNLSITDVYGTLKAVNNKEQDYSIEFGVDVISEVKLEIICKDELVNKAVDIIRKYSRTGQEIAGYIFISDITKAIPINNE